MYKILTIKFRDIRRIFVDCSFSQSAVDMIEQAIHVDFIQKNDPRELSGRMTLEAYGPDRLDQLALRLLDVCAQLRGMARRSREEQLGTVALHDKKALEWIARLEEWSVKTAADLEVQVHKTSGQRKAQAVLRSADARSPQRPASSGA